MESATYFNPGIQRYFKLSDLAGSRWPNVTEDDIFQWHDAAYKPVLNPLSLPLNDLLKELWPDEELPESARLAFEECLDETGELASIIDTIKELWPQEKVPKDVIDAMETLWRELSIPDSLQDATIAFWEDNTCSLAEINLMGFWMFFPEFRSYQIEEERTYEFAPFKLLSNCFLRIDTENARGFTFNKEGKINCAELFDEEGNAHYPSEFHGNTAEYHPGQVTIKKEYLLIKASSVALMEQILPEITSHNFQAGKNNILPPTTEASADEIRAKKRADKRKERTDLVTIGALISLLRDETDFKTNTKIIDTILDRHKKVFGLGERTLQERFSDAKKALKNTTID